MLEPPTIAILAGGLATRLGDLATHTPKSLLPIGGRPFLAWQLELMADKGLTDVVLCVGHHGQQIVDSIGQYMPASIRVRYSFDGEQRVGTGGAIQRALPLLGETFLVTYGDSYLRADYIGIYEYFLQHRQNVPDGGTAPLGLMTVYQNDNQFDASNVVFEGGRIAKYSKTNITDDMRHIDWGLGVLTAQAFTRFASNAVLDLATVYASLVSDGKLLGYEVLERFYEIGSRQGLDEFAEKARRGTLQSAKRGL
jgi:NDP-sugar pyrophosphorylase family protein